MASEDRLLHLPGRRQTIVFLGMDEKNLCMMGYGLPDASAETVACL
jgi:hypothetical protein